MKFLFVVPRFHTNLQGYVSALREGGHSVEILASAPGATESYRLLLPLVHKQSAVSKVFSCIFGRGGGDRSNIFPSISEAFRLIRYLDPDILVIRNPKRITALIMIFLAKIQKKKL